MTNKEIFNAYVGDTHVEKIYLGTDIVWGGGEPEPDYSKMPLTFKIISGGTISWRATSTAFTKEIQYSVNDGPWVSITSTTAGTPISLNDGDIVKFLGDGAISTGRNETNRFRDSTIVFEVYGNIMSLIDSTGFATATTAADHSFRQLFENQSGLTSAQNLVLPATTIGTNVYKGMFKNCTELVTAPSELPATALTESCYYDMFYNCTRLTTAPELPATTLAQSCYQYMFYNCTRLTTAPALPATTLAQGCYGYMFAGCTSLLLAPEILATDHGTYTCTSMFSGCINLNYIKCMFNPAPSGSEFIIQTRFWVSGVAASGTFVKHPDATWPSGVNGIPTNWTIIDAEI